MPARSYQRKNGTSRNPDRTRERILVAALAEFSKSGFAGARVDTIALRARVNKRMLYHYFGDKKQMLRAVLNFKLEQRMEQFKSYAPAGMAAGISRLFQQNTLDLDWVRMLAWESLQTKGNRVHDEQERRQAVIYTNGLIRQQQAEGKLHDAMKPEFFHLAMASLALFPLALPQLTRLITGQTVLDKKFQQDYARFLETISEAFRP